jgi:hypothetical protein
MLLIIQLAKLSTLEASANMRQATTRHGISSLVGLHIQKAKLDSRTWHHAIYPKGPHLPSTWHLAAFVGQKQKRMDERRRKKIGDSHC